MNISVLHILNSAHGGSAISTFELSKELTKLGVVSSLICFNNTDETQRQKIEAQFEGRVIFIPLYWMNKRIRSALWKRPVIEALSLLKTWKGYRYQRQISGFIAKHKINIIHSSTILNIEGAIASKRNNLPHVWHVRELVGPENHFHFYNYKKWAKYVATHCNILVANSSVTEKCLQDYFPHDKIICIPNGISVDQFQIKDHTNRKAKIVIGMVGSITTRWKNHEFFIRTAAHFTSVGNVEFKIYGSLPASNDPYYLFLQKLIGDLKTSVVFESFKSPPAIMAEIDIMFHPSEYESFGRIYVEAMAAGIPVLGLKAGGALEIIKPGDNGYLIEKDDIHGVVEKLQLLILDSNLRNKLGQSGRTLVEGKYSLSSLAEKMLALYRRVNI